MVKYITYKKKQYPFRLSHRAAKSFKKETGKNVRTVFIQQSDTDLDESVYERILYHGLLAGAKADEVEMCLNEEQMEDVLDEVGIISFLHLVSLFFPKGMPDDDFEKKPEPV